MPVVTSIDLVAEEIRENYASPRDEQWGQATPSDSFGNCAAVHHVTTECVTVGLVGWLVGCVR